MKALMKKIKVFLVILLAIYLFVMYGNNSHYQQTDIKIAYSQETKSELSSDINSTNEEGQDINNISEEGSEPEADVQPKSYDLSTTLGREEYIWDFLIRCKFSKVQAAGIIGNMRGENSGLVLSKEELGNNIGYGLIQWSYGRRDNLFAFAKEKGMSPSSIDLQLMFFLKEYNTNGWAGHKSERLTFKNTESVSEATKAFCDGFERPGVPRLEVRQKYALEAYEKYSK